MKIDRWHVFWTGILLFVVICVIFVTYCAWTGWKEAKIRSGHSKNLYWVRLAAESISELPQSRMAEIAPSGKAIALQNLIAYFQIPDNGYAFLTQDDLFLITDKDFILAYQGSREEGHELLDRIKILHLSHDANVLRYDATNGTASAGKDFCIIKRQY